MFDLARKGLRECVGLDQLKSILASRNHFKKYLSLKMVSGKMISYSLPLLRIEYNALFM